MRDRAVRVTGLILALAYSALIAWLNLSQPQTLAEVTGGLTASVGAYRVDPTAFDDGRLFFERDQFVEARAAFARADPALRDPRTQFYIAYSYYREGWGRLSHDDELYARGLATVDRAIAVAADGRIVVDDPGLAMHTADELRAELEAGISRDLSDISPLRLFRGRK